MAVPVSARVDRGRGRRLLRIIIKGPNRSVVGLQAREPPRSCPRPGAGASKIAVSAPLAALSAVFEAETAILC